MVLVGKKAPLFSTKAVINGNEIVDNFSLDQFLGEKYVILFFYPADFTFVCPTELVAFQKQLKSFEERDCVVIAGSTDSAFSHLTWLSTPREQGGIKGVTYPLISDQSLNISSEYDVLAGEYDYDDRGLLVLKGDPQAYRGLFLIDKKGIVRHQVVNDMALGRSIDEALRVLDALQFTEKYGEVCPANWKEGAEAIKPTHESVSKYLAKE